MSQRIVISGMGLLSSAGLNLSEARPRLVNGICCLSPIQVPGTEHLRAKYAGLVPGFTPDPVLSPELKAFDKHVFMAITAAQEALADAHVCPSEFGRRMGLVFATCSGPMLLIEEHYRRIVRGAPHIDAEQLFAKRYYAGARALAHVLRVQGLCTTLVTACSASTAAIALAADLVRCGILDAALAGGADAFSVSTLAGFDGLKATCDGRCAPFSKPFGLNLGEAAAFVLVETEQGAQQRRATIHAEIRGSGSSNDAYHRSSPQPNGSGLALAMERALRQAGLSPRDITYVNAHGTGTEANDKAECRALRRVFGEQLTQLPVSSTKSLVGHCLGAAGAVETIASVVCAQAGVLPPTANFSEAREGCAVDCVSTAGRPWSGSKTFLCNNSAFGGHNASLVISAPNTSRPEQAQVDPRRPIFVTAATGISSAGLGTAALRTALETGRTALSSVPLTLVPPVTAGLIDDKAVAAFDRRLDLREMDRSSRWAAITARLALREGGLADKACALSRVGLFVHLSAGPSWAEGEYLTSFFSNHGHVTQVAVFPSIVLGSVTGNVCRALGLNGHNLTFSAGPGAGLLGLGLTATALRCGHADALLSGSTDELTERILTDGFLAGSFSGADATLPGEGAAMLLLETEKHMTARGAKPLAEVCGLAYGTEVTGCRHPIRDQRALSKIVQEALQQAGWTAEEVDCLCFQGPRMRLDQVAALLCPAWTSRLVRTSHLTGCMEASQGLLDLALTLTGPAKPQRVLAVAASAHGTDGVVALRLPGPSPNISRWQP